MDQMELKSGKALVKGDQKKDCDNDPEEDVQSLLEGYAVGGNDDESLIPPPPKDRKYRLPPRPPFLPAMDISSFRYPPTSVTTSADQTSARCLPWPVLEPQRNGRFNIYIFFIYLYIYKFVLLV